MEELAELLHHLGTSITDDELLLCIILDPSSHVNRLTAANQNVDMQFLETLTQRLTYKLHCKRHQLLGLGSIGKTSSARESLTIDTHHLLTSSDKLDTLPPDPTSFEPLPNSLVPPQKFTKAYLVLLFLKRNRVAKAVAIKTALR